MKVKITQKIDGFLDGAPWPRPGTVVDLPPGLANRLVVAGQAKAVEEPKPRRRR